MDTSGSVSIPIRWNQTEGPDQAAGGAKRRCLSDKAELRIMEAAPTGLAIVISYGVGAVLATDPLTESPTFARCVLWAILVMPPWARRPTRSRMKSSRS